MELLNPVADVLQNTRRFFSQRFKLLTIAESTCNRTFHANTNINLKLILITKCKCGVLPVVWESLVIIFRFPSTRALIIAE